jgi:putative nucleotidyltransferase with HDIG domain
MQQAKEIMDALWRAGYEAYIVGGAVRDMLLGGTPSDIDICTAATPAEVREVAQEKQWQTYEVGAAFGTVVLVVDRKGYEVTTFRRETYGQDSHRPENVEFSRSLADDLARRDFTVNALCLDREGTLIDFFGGKEDLREGILRAVGEARERFAEDALRMFRAARFIAKLGFDLDEAILPAARDNLERVRGLSVERVRAELERILLAPFAGKGFEFLLAAGLLEESCRAKEEKREEDVPILPELARLEGIEQNPRYHRLDVWRHTLNVVENVPRHSILRWAALLHDVAKGTPGVRGLNSRGEISDHGHEVAGAEMAAKILQRLRVDKETTQAVIWLVRYHMALLAPEEKTLKRWLRKRAAEFKEIESLRSAIEHWCLLVRADRIAKQVPTADTLAEVEELLRVLLATVPFYTRQLALGGGNIAEIIGSGPQVAAMQRLLLERVQAGQLENTADQLAQAVCTKGWRQRKEL